jgi:3-methyladenine DNA glycosylase AlkD
MNRDEVLQRLEALRNPEAVLGMAKYGINPDYAYGIAIPHLRQLAKDAGRDHNLAQQLWSTEIHEARILASMVDDPRLVTEAQLEAWVNDFNSWDLCDQCCSNLFEKTPLAYAKAVEWSEREAEFVKRAGFVMMARLAVSDKKAADVQFEPFLPIIEREAGDQRNFVKKAVNWALRQIGKRNLYLNQKAIAAAGRIQQRDSKSARWIAADALRELTSEAVQSRVNR